MKTVVDHINGNVLVVDDNQENVLETFDLQSAAKFRNDLSTAIAQAARARKDENFLPTEELEG